MISYVFNITERDTNNVVASIQQNSTLPMIVKFDSGNGLLPIQVYHLVIEAENSAGKTLSEEFMLCKFITFEP